MYIYTEHTHYYANKNFILDVINRLTGIISANHAM